MFKNLKSLFIVTEETNTEETPTPKDTPVKEQKQPQQQAVLTQPETSNVPPDPKFQEMLLKALEENKMQGLDYLEFKQSMQAMAKITVDESTRFQSAFAMAQTMGLTFTKLVDTATYYMQVLDREQQKFMDSLKQQGEGKTKAMIEEVQNLDKAIAEKQAVIQKMQDEIAQHQQRSDEIKKGVAEHSQRVDALKGGFDSSYHDLRGQIQSDIEKINQYLK